MAKRQQTYKREASKRKAAQRARAVARAAAAARKSRQMQPTAPDAKDEAPPSPADEQGS